MVTTNRSAVVFATCASLLAIVITSAVTVLAVSPMFNTVQYLRFSAPVSLPGVTLDAGEYSFQVNTVDSGNVVQVRARETRRPVFTGFTIPVERPRDLGKGALVTFGEALPGQPRPIRAWFPVEARRGYAFVWPDSAR
jgi:hypothetical protein